MSSVQVAAIKKALLILWKYKGQIAEALTFIPGARMIQSPDGTWRIK